MSIIIMECIKCQSNPSFICQCSNKTLCDIHFGQHMIEPGVHNFQKLVSSISQPLKAELTEILTQRIQILKSLKLTLHVKASQLINLIDSHTTSIQSSINIQISHYMDLLSQAQFQKSQIEEINSIISSQFCTKDFNINFIKQEINQTFTAPAFYLQINEKKDKLSKKIKFLQGHNSSFNCISLSDDGEFIAAGADDSSVRIWDLNLKKQVACLIGHKASVKSSAFSRDGKVLASGSVDRNVVLWDVESRMKRKKLKGHCAEVTCLGFAGDGRFLVSGSKAREVFIWSVEKLKLVKKIMVNGEVMGGFVSSCGWIVAGISNSLKVWDLLTYNRINSIKAHNSPILSISSSTDETLICTSSSDKKIKLWQSQSLQLKLILPVPDQEILSTCISPDNTFLFSGSSEGTLIKWSLESKSIIHKFSIHSSSITCIKSSNNLIYTSSSDSSIKIFQIFTNSLISHLHTTKFNSNTQTINQNLVSYGQSNQIFIFNLINSDEFQLNGHIDQVTATCFSIKLKILASASKGNENNLILWDLDSKNLICLLNGHNESVFCVDLYEDKKLLASGDKDSKVLVWDLDKRKLEFVFKGHCGSVFIVKFAKSGKFLASAGEDFGVFVWNVEDKSVFAKFEGHEDRVLVLVWTEKEDFLVSADLSDGVRVWNLEQKELALAMKDYNESVEWIEENKEVKDEIKWILC